MEERRSDRTQTAKRAVIFARTQKVPKFVLDMLNSPIFSNGKQEMEQILYVAMPKYVILALSKMQRFRGSTRGKCKASRSL